MPRPGSIPVRQIAAGEWMNQRQSSITGARGTGLYANNSAGDECVATTTRAVEWPPRPRVSRSGSYRFRIQNRGRTATWICGTRFSGSQVELAQLRASTHHCRTAALGWQVNPNRVYRFMREDNLQ
jgi:hypothetical protein